MVVRRDFTIGGEICQLEVLHREVEAFGRDAGLSAAALFELNLALDELVTNVISHGLAGATNRASRIIQVDLRREDEAVWAIVADDGVPFDPTAAPAPDTRCSLQDRCLGGLGIHLARNLVDELRYERSGGRNVVRLRKVLTRGEGPEA